MSSNVIGQVIGRRYRVDAFIASGSMGDVYRIWDLQRNVPLAMKTLHADLADNPSMFKHFKREANALKKLAHPNIVQFYGLEQEDELVFILQAFINGASLKEILKQRKALTLQEALVYLKALCSSLGYAHIQNVVHCDVKPGNVMVDQGGNIYLMDFGIARHADSSTTSTFAGAGTPGYMAPEQVLQQPVSPATDIYALGAMFFELVTGQRPFTGYEPELLKTGTTINERVRFAHLKVLPPDPRKINAALPPALSAALLRALAKQPAERYASTQEFLAAICAACSYNVEDVPPRVGMQVAAISLEPPKKELVGAFPVGTAGLAGRLFNDKRVRLGLAGVALMAIMIFIMLEIIPPLRMPTRTPTIVSTTSAITRTPTSTVTSTVIATRPVPTGTPTLKPSPTEDLGPVTPPPIFAAPALIKTDEMALVTLYVTSARVPVIAYQTQGNETDKLRVLTKSGQMWSQEALPGEFNKKRAGWPSFAENRSGNLLIGYFDFDNKGIHYLARDDNRNWSDNYLPLTGKYFTATSSSVDSQSAIHLAAILRDNGGVYYATSSGGGEVKQVDATGFGSQVLVAGSGYAASLAVDSGDIVHIAYPTSDGLCYARVMNGVVSGKETVDKVSGGVLFPSLAVDKGGDPYISYYDPKSQSLKLVRRVGSQWQPPQVIDPGPQVGLFTSLKVDKQGCAHIAYSDEPKNALKYAWICRGQQELRTVDAKNNGKWVSLALDANGLPYISYYNEATHKLLFAQPAP